MEDQNQGGSGASARYIYAVIPRVARVRLGAIGIGGARVYTLPHRAIAAVVHDRPPEPYQGEPETVAGWVKVHNNVIDRAWSEADENVRQWLELEYSNLQAKLDEFRNKVELGVQVLWDPAVIAQRIVESSEEIKALRAEMATKSRGAAYFIEHKIASAVKEEMERKAQRDFTTCYQRLKERSEGTCVNKVRKQDDRAMIANLSLLVRRERVQEIGAVLQEAGDEQGVEIRFTGPWPPYTFAATVGVIGGEPESSRRGNAS